MKKLFFNLVVFTGYGKVEEGYSSLNTYFRRIKALIKGGIKFHLKRIRCISV